MTEKKNPISGQLMGGNEVIFRTGGASITGYEHSIPGANFPVSVLNISHRLVGIGSGGRR